MSDTIFILVFYLISGMGFISVVWLRKGLRSISDNLIKRMFTYLVLLTFVCFIYATWKFILLQNMSSEALIITFTDAIIITSLFALISGAALCAKQIGELYGFKVGEVRK